MWSGSADTYGVDYDAVSGHLSLTQQSPTPGVIQATFDLSQDGYWH